MFETSTQWTIVEPKLCDVCGKRAAWRHPLGGLRCETCPRPDVKLFGIFDVAQRRWWPRTFKTFDEAQAHYDRCKGDGSQGEVQEYPYPPPPITEALGYAAARSGANED
jgi:hypothetical protein